MISKSSFNNFLVTLFGFGKTKSKVHILLIVCIHALAWFLLFLLPVLFYPVRVNVKYFYNHELIGKFALVGIFYLNYYVLMPRYFLRKKYGWYGLIVFVMFLSYLVLTISVRDYYLNRVRASFFNLPERGTDSVRGDQVFMLRGGGFSAPPDHAPPGARGRIFAPADRIVFERDSLMAPPERGPFGGALMMQKTNFFGVSRGVVFMSLNNAVSSFALLLLMGGFIRLSFSFIRNQNEKKALENANLNAEVNFLKAQINPHFLFNTLNSIYSQAHNRSENTEYSILKLSELFRYVLYESGGNQVELAKDIQYVTNYIDLQKIRLSSKVTIDYSVNGQLYGHKIAPLLLITFIENAFKHGISYTNASRVNIEIEVFEETLTLSVSNPVVERNSFASGGVGLKNVIRRLDILYPGKYQLDIHNDGHVYIVKLKLDLHSD